MSVTKKCNPHVPHLVAGNVPCTADAVAKYIWPTSGKESYVCQDRLWWIENLTQNLGVQVNITKLLAIDPYESAPCPAEGCGKGILFTFMDRGETAKVRWQKAFVCPEHGEFTPPSKGGAESGETLASSGTDTLKEASATSADALRIPPLSPVVENGTTHRESAPRVSAQHLPECGMLDIEGKEHWLCQTACPVAELWRPVAEAQSALLQWQAHVDADEEYQRLFKENPAGVEAATRLLWLKKLWDERKAP